MSMQKSQRPWSITVSCYTEVTELTCSVGGGTSSGGSSNGSGGWQMVVVVVAEAVVVVAVNWSLLHIIKTISQYFFTILTP
jgi:hypothetical protein